MSKQVVLYARISISTDDSVSVERQLSAGRSYAAARGWDVVGEFVDDGVSASSNRPEKRAGWRALLDTPQRYDAVVIWKIDRLARKVLDFLHADADLQARGAGIVAVEDPVDMTTAQGRAFATLLAVFGEMEAAAISARVTAARSHLLKSGRAVGGTATYGWMKVDNPDGPGKVLAFDPERIEWVRRIVARAQRGDTIYSIKTYLDEAGAPLPSASGGARKNDEWSASTVERLLRNPILAGATPYNPGNTTSHKRGAELLRDGRGLPVVDAGIAVMTLEEWRALGAKLDARDSPQSKPHALRKKSSALLSGLVFCGDQRHGTDLPRMRRKPRDGNDGYACPVCHQALSGFEPLVVEHFLEQKGDWMRWSKVIEEYEGGAEELPEVEHRLTELDELIRDAASREDRLRLRNEQDALFDERDRLRQMPGTVVERWNEGDATFRSLWSRADEIEERRAVLDDALDRIVIIRGHVGRRGRAEVLSRLRFEWKRPDEIGPRPDPTPAELAEIG